MLPGIAKTPANRGGFALADQRIVKIRNGESSDSQKYALVVASAKLVLRHAF
jgi:hypothetical protein